MNNNTVGVAPAILRLHPGLDQGQLQIIGHLDGPTLGIAGPGAGKTLAVALRGTNILLLGRARPEELVLCTYSRAAAGELRQRITTLATAAGYTGDPSRVRIVTIHGLCRRILHSDARRAGLRSSFAALNEDEQWRLLLRRFDDVFGPDLDVLEREGWRWGVPRLVIRHARKYFERICDEFIDPGELISSWDPFHVALGRCYLRYRELLQDEGNADFDHARQHYVAFSRPWSLLVLTASGPVHPRFDSIWNDLPRWDRMDRRSLARQRFRPATAPPELPRVIPYLKRLDVWVGRAEPAATRAELRMPADLRS